jgi:hypothetical protein
VVINGHYSNWVNVISGVPQGSVLGPLLFVIYINDIDCNLRNLLLKFADDTKLLGQVASQNDVQAVHADLVTLSKWSQDWLMPFNTDKCKVMHFGGHNSKEIYNLNGVALKEVKEETDLGVIVQNNLKVSSQCTKVVKSANRTLGLIRRTFTSRNKAVILPLYKALVRPQLEYCVQAWRPHLSKDVNLLENVQKRALRLVDGCYRVAYDQLLNRFDMTTLEQRRVRGDMIELFKMFKGLVKGDVLEKYFVLSRNSLRGHRYKLFKKSVVSNTGKFAFSNRVVNTWNSLPDEILSCSTVSTFKHKLDLHFKHVNSS